MVLDRKIIYFLLLVVMTITVALFVTRHVSAAVSSSASYKMQSDSINVGGVPVSSASYKLENSSGETATGDSSSASYKVKAGYQQMIAGAITLSTPADITMSQPLTLTEDTATGSTTWKVTTDNPVGYTLTITAEATSGCADNDGLGVADALCDVATNEAFDDLSTTSKATWSVSNTFGFGWSAYGDDNTGFGTGSSCDTGDTHTPSTTLTYQGFDGTNTSFEFASSTTATSASGTDTTVCFAVEQDTVLSPSGNYQATTTATALAQ